MTVVANKLAAQVVQKAFENSQSETAKPLQNGQSSFQEMLQNTGEEMGFAEMLGIDTQMHPQGQAQAISAASIPVEGVSPDGRNGFSPDSGQKLVDMLGEFNQQQMHMDGLVNEILYSNKKFSNQELLAIQAHVFHVAQLTELTVKSVELAVSSFKGVMNTQIQ